MIAGNRICFVIMPFREEFHYFYLYLQRHIESKHNVVCKRGDADVLTVPLLDKIKSYIDEADVLIADCSGRNANVFYELGMAHALGKRVILITKEKVEDAPTDIRHLEFIQYELTRDKEFFALLDKALQKVFIDRYDDLFNIATKLFNEFKQTTKAKPKLLDKQAFIEAMISSEQAGELPDLADDQGLRDFLLPKAVANKDQKDVISAIAEWYQAGLPPTPTAAGTRYPNPEPPAPGFVRSEELDRTKRGLKRRS